MSVIAARAFVGIAAITLLAAVAWLVLVGAGPHPHLAAVTAPALIALLSATALLVAVPLFSRFVDASIERDALVVRSVLRPRRVLALEDIAEVVVIESLLLPARSATSVQRLVVRMRAGGVMAVTVRDAGLGARLRARDVVVSVDSEPLAPGQAARRYPGASSAWERILDVMMWAAVIVPVIVVIWLLVSR